MIKKASQKLLKIVQKSSKSACRAYQEFMQKKLRRKTQQMPKSVEHGPQNGWFLRGGKAPKSQKNRGAFKMGPQASKMSPRASKITQNHENLVTQNQENPRKKTSRNGTVAGYARSALVYI